MVGGWWLVVHSLISECTKNQKYDYENVNNFSKLWNSIDKIKWTGHRERTWPHYTIIKSENHLCVKVDGWRSSVKWFLRAFNSILMHFVYLRYENGRWTRLYDFFDIEFGGRNHSKEIPNRWHFHFHSKITNNNHYLSIKSILFLCFILGIIH